MTLLVIVIAVAAAAALAVLSYRVLKAAHSRPPAHPAADGHGPLERAVLATVTGLIRSLLRLGLAPAPMRMLGVRGRTTGIIRTNPVDVYDAGDRSVLWPPTTRTRTGSATCAPRGRGR